MKWLGWVGLPVILLLAGNAQAVDSRPVMNCIPVNAMNAPHCGQPPVDSTPAPAGVTQSLPVQVFMQNAAAFQLPPIICFKAPCGNDKPPKPHSLIPPIICFKAPCP